MTPLGRAIGSAVLLAPLISGVSRAQTSPPQEAATICPRAAAGGTTAAAIDTWRPPNSAPHGLQEFDRSTRVILPPGTSSVVVELWGGGGGGGGGSFDTLSEGGSGGGGGASGSYTRAVLPIDSETPYLLMVIGVGGHGGFGQKPTIDATGRDGEPTLVCSAASVLAFAGGGRGGQGARSTARGGPGGESPASLPQAADVHRTGTRGGNGSVPLFELPGRGGAGGRAVSGSVSPPASNGGNGGVGAMTPERAGDGDPGGSGHALLSW